ncbi:TetR/AcrR family transcriptional regulator [Prauserella muralis]|uniref:TetR family transcriptional regulator n=1 Tax=Prauserella muralis TaxID=588067 RepID=A0A2V4ATM2_9PSEU|nr:TetR family transcriptional regulator [Prauserella muralis]PXY18897.1 TetR family transcriptional regulator [Prauserella muralis]TWE28766.1 TetR family transcriptional regulator [Prauserella muralis]
MAVSARESGGSRRYGQGREALLQAAVQVVADQGLRNLTYRAVARKAGVAHALVAHHFGSREALLTAALRFSLDNSVTTISARPGSGDLDALFVGLSTLVEANPHDQAFQYELILESRRRPELRPYVVDIYQTYVNALHAELEHAGVQPDVALTHVIYAAADGLVFHQLTIGNPDLTERSLQRLRSLLKTRCQDSDPAAATGIAGRRCEERGLQE